MAERLGRGLQSLVQRFESAPRLLFPQIAGFSGSHSLRQRSFGEPHARDQFVLVGVHVVLARGRDRGVAHEHPRQLEVAGRAAKLVPGCVAKLVHREVGRASLSETSLEPAVHRRRLHRPVAVLAHDALEVRVRAGVADPDRVKDVLVGAFQVLPAGEPGRTRPSAIPKRICSRADELRRDFVGLRSGRRSGDGTGGVAPLGPSLIRC